MGSSERGGGGTAEVNLSSLKRFLLPRTQTHATDAIIYIQIRTKFEIR